MRLLLGPRSKIDMILKAEIMFFHMVSAFNEACCAATGRIAAQLRVCVVGLYLGSPQQTTSTTPAGSPRRRPSQSSSCPSIASTSSSNESYWSWLSTGRPRSAIAKWGGLRFSPGLRGLFAASTQKLVDNNIDKSKERVYFRQHRVAVLFIRL